LAAGIDAYRRAAVAAGVLRGAVSVRHEMRTGMVDHGLVHGAVPSRGAIAPAVVTWPPRVTLLPVLLGLIVPLIMRPQAVSAAPPDAPPVAVRAGSASPSPSEPDNTGDDFGRPVNVFQLYTQYATAPGNGAEKNTLREVTSEIVKLRGDQRIDLPGGWLVALREDLPFVAKDPINSGNPSGDYGTGIGDVDAQAALIHVIDARWTAGFGARLIAPTGDVSLGSGKWQVVPVVGLRYALPEISAGSYFEPLVWYDVSFAGDPTRKSISNLRLEPTLRLALPDRWFFTFYPSPDIRVNYGDPVAGQTGRLFLPLDVQLGRKVADNLAVSLEIGVPIIKDYPVYDFKSAVRLNWTF
jgi:hypothetical protein